jgi:hypothetical protein
MARIAPSATGTLYVLVVRVSFISSALPAVDAGAAGEAFAESLLGAAAGLAVFFLGAARVEVEPVFGILFSS